MRRANGATPKLPPSAQPLDSVRRNPAQRSKEHGGTVLGRRRHLGAQRLPAAPAGVGCSSGAQVG